MRFGFKRIAVEIHKLKPLRSVWKPNHNNGRFWHERLQCGVQAGFVTVVIMSAARSIHSRPAGI